MASTITVKPEKLAPTVMDMLKAYDKACFDDLKTITDKVAKDMRDGIKAGARKRTGALSKSWSVKQLQKTSTVYQVTVWSPKRYRLAHLIENGHHLVYFGRDTGKNVRAFPYIAPVADKYIPVYEKEIIAMLTSNGNA